jgi:hypothetical protein
MSLVPVYKGYKKTSNEKRDKLLSNLIKSINDTNEKYKGLEKRVEVLNKQNESIKLQMQQIYQESFNKK